VSNVDAEPAGKLVVGAVGVLEDGGVHVVKAVGVTRAGLAGQPASEIGETRVNFGHGCEATGVR
jgi:hypothetical protein